MKYILKRKTSPILVNGWRYPANRTIIIAELEIEQGNFCAYTEYQFNPGTARDIEHFNPTLKGTTNDGYRNWYAVSHRWNNKIKGTKWFHPCYSPSSKNLSKIYVYSNGFYLYNLNDTKADNLAKMIGLNELPLVKERNRFIESLNYLVNEGIDLKEFFKKHPERVMFRTAIKAVFGFLP